MCFLFCAVSLVCLCRTQGLRPSILSKLIFSLRDMVNGPVIAVAIWILGEYCEVNFGDCFAIMRCCVEHATDGTIAEAVFFFLLPFL